MADQKANPVSSVIGAIVILIALWYFFGGGLEKHTTETRKTIEKNADQEMKRIQQKVADDAVT